MRVKSAAIASLILLALSLAVPVSAAEKSDTGKTVTCKDGTTSKDGKGGACSHDGGVQQGGASDSAHDKNAGKAADKPTAKCKDGTMSHSKEHSGTCSQHGGVAQWLDKDDKK